MEKTKFLQTLPPEEQFELIKADVGSAAALTVPTDEQRFVCDIEAAKAKFFGTNSSERRVDRT